MYFPVNMFGIANLCDLHGNEIILLSEHARELSFLSLQLQLPHHFDYKVVPFQWQEYLNEIAGWMSYKF